MTIKNYLKSHSFTLLEIEKIISFGEVVSLKKGECFLKENEFCNQIGMLLTGLLCGYYFDSNGNKKIFRFYYNPDFYLVVDYENFVKNTHSNLNIEALEETTLFVLKKKPWKQFTTKCQNLEICNNRKLPICLSEHCELLKYFKPPTPQSVFVFCKTMPPNCLPKCRIRI